LSPARRERASENRPADLAEPARRQHVDEPTRTVTLRLAEQLVLRADEALTMPLIG
jgi:hypothetical protein